MPQKDAPIARSRIFTKADQNTKKDHRRNKRKKDREKGELTVEHAARVYANSGALIGDDKQSNYTKRAVSRRYGGRGGRCYDSRKAHVPGTRRRTRTKWLE